METKWGIATTIIFFGLFFYACSGDSLPPGMEQHMQQVELQNQQNLRQRQVSEGIITGPDFRMCPSPCCGGWNITIDSAYYTFSNFPDSSGIDPVKEKFPLKVYLRWAPDTVLRCNHIIVRWMCTEDSPLPVR